MFTIYLCDDNSNLRKAYTDLLKQLAAKNGELVSVRQFSTGDSLLFALEESPDSADIIYLDIVMPGTNGIDTAKKLRACGCSSELIFLTSAAEYVFDAFDVSATNYILKDSRNTAQFESVLKRAIHNVKSKKTDYFLCKSGSTGKRIPISSILYFEISARIITVHYNKEAFDFYSNMSALEKTLSGKGFVRVHRSFVVNIRAIESLHADHLILVNGSEIPVGRTYLGDVQSDVSDYISKTF